MTKEKNNKPSKELPLGFVDRQEKELLVRDFIISNIKEVMIKYGFQYLETPSFEYSDSIGKFLPDKERPDEGVFSFKDENKWLSLRYDLTAPLARYVAKNYLEIPKPFKRYQLGTVWRNEKPGSGRFREFLQFDADFVGTKSLQADAELCIMISEILEKCGLTKSEYIIKISSRKITEELFKKINIKDNQQRLTALRALDKIDRLGWNGVKELLGEGRKDNSGDFTKGANLEPEDIKTVEETLKKNSPETEDLVEILKIFKDYNFNNFELDPSVIRGLEYYTGVIFEVNLKFNVTNNKGQVIQFGSIGGGGRYDNLTAKFGGKDLSGVGISLGFERVLMALHKFKLFPKGLNNRVQVLIANFGFKTSLICNSILKKLRAKGVNSEFYPDDSKLKKQLSYANSKKIEYVLLLGDEELKNEEFFLKNMNEGTQVCFKISQLESVVLSRLKK